MAFSTDALLSDLFIYFVV